MTLSPPEAPRRPGGRRTLTGRAPCITSHAHHNQEGNHMSEKIIFKSGESTVLAAEGQYTDAMPE
jgi:hypothetical protein